MNQEVEERANQYVEKLDNLSTLQKIALTQHLINFTKELEDDLTKWKVDDTVIIKCEIYGHLFNVGDAVVLIEYDPEITDEAKWKAMNMKGDTWWIAESEAILYKIIK
jgi:hypothetical protein